MTIRDVIHRLQWERGQIDKALAALEALEETKRLHAETPGRRGRKGMGREERLEVSRRMKQYWANQRKGAA